MLAEWEARDLHECAFDMTYAWTWYDDLRELTTGRKKDLGGLRGYYSWNESYYPQDIMRMTFVSNHDKNAWEGTESSNSARDWKRRSFCLAWAKACRSSTTARKPATPSA